MIRPTLRAALGFGAILPIALLALMTRPGSWPFVVGLAAFALGVVVLDAALGQRLGGLNIAATAPPRVYVGAKLGLFVSIAGAVRAPRFEAILEVKGPAGPPPLASFRARPDQRAETEIPISSDRRGVVGVEALWLRWRGPLGLAERIARIALNARIEIVPDIRSIQQNAIRFDNREFIDGQKVERQRGEGAEFDALREHMPGMDNRFIDWKQSAKHRKLFSKEFKIERNHQIVLAYDTGRLMAEPLGGLARLDHAIHAGLQLGWVSLRTGDFVGSYGFDARLRHYLSPTRGMRAFAHLQRGATELGYFSEETNYTLGLAELNARLKRRALVVLFTEFVDTTTAQLLLDSVQRMANRHAVVFVTIADPFIAATADAAPKDFLTVARALVAGDFARERGIVRERLQRMGVHCLEAPARGLAVSLVNRYLAIKQRGLL